MSYPFSRFVRLLFLSSIVAAISFGVTSCGSPKHMASAKSGSSYARSHGSSQPKKSTGAKHASKPKEHIDVAKLASNPVTKNLLSEVDSWLGTPYAWGGNDRNGVDCSGFVTQVYLNSLAIALPRTSELQMQHCKPIDRKELVPGDLVFFTVRGGDRVGHVGIYIGEGKMAHSSSSKGVIVTPLDNPYFVANYYSSGRVERYMAMVDAKTPKPKTVAPKDSKPLPERSTKPSAPLMAKANDTKPAQPQPAAKPVTKATKPEMAKKKSKKAESAPAAVFATPLPEQVFASKQHAAEAEDMESPEFFD